MAEPQKLTIKDFLAREEHQEVRALIGKFNGGSFMCCHTHIYVLPHAHLCGNRNQISGPAAMWTSPDTGSSPVSQMFELSYH